MRRSPGLPAPRTCRWFAGEVLIHRSADASRGPNSVGCAAARGVAAFTGVPLAMTSTSVAVLTAASSFGLLLGGLLLKYRKLGASDLTVSEISLGSWLTYGVGVERDKAAACVDTAFELGINSSTPPTSMAAARPRPCLARPWRASARLLRAGHQADVADERRPTKASRAPRCSSRSTPR